MKHRRLWFLVHGWLSLPIWLLFCLICLTGTISVISHELTWLTNPNARASNPEAASAKPLPQLLAAVEAAVPGAEISQVLVYEPYLATRVGVTSKEIPYALVYVNPYTGKVQEINQGLNFIDFMRSLHGWLLFPWQSGYSVGYYLVSLMSLVVLGALGTGLVIYKKFWRAFTRPRIRTDRGGRALLGDLHRLAGAWSLWFLLIMGATGLWYLSQAILWHTANDVWEHPEPIALAELPTTEGAPPRRLSLEQALARVQEALPSIQPAWIALPEHHRDYYSIAGSGDAVLFDAYAYRAFVNPWTGELKEVRQPATMNLWQALSHLADPLHYGSFGGLWTKAIWFLFGLVLTGMSITGFLIWGKRTAQGLRESTQESASAAPLEERMA